MLKKLFTLSTLSIVASLTLIGCSNDSKEPITTPDTDATGQEKVEITYVNWNLGTEEENNLERQMIAAYMELNPNVEIKIAENIDTAAYMDSLTTAAAAGSLPDVMMLQDIPTPLGNEWLLDLSELTAADEEWSLISAPVVESTTYNGAPYAIPAGQYLLGYYINTDLFAQENVPVLDFGYTLEDFDKAVKSLTSLNKGFIGLEDEITIADWYASVKNSDLGWFTWDGEKYNLDSPEFKEGIAKAKELASNGYVFGALSPEEQQNFKGTNGYECWIEGEVAFKYDGTWSANGMKELGFDTKFIALPNSKSVIVNDYFGITKSTKNPEVAYDFAKWMTFSKEGMLKRIEIAEEQGIIYGSLPIISDDELMDRYLEHNPIEGLKEIYTAIDNAVVETLKSVPGYGNSRWNASTGLKVGDRENATIGDLVFDCIRGTAKIEDYVAQLNDLSNEQYEIAVNSIQALQ